MTIENKRLTEARENRSPWKNGDLILAKDNGAGLGASHQTGWSGLVAKLIQFYGSVDAKQLLDVGKEAAFIKGTGEIPHAEKVKKIKSPAPHDAT